MNRLFVKFTRDVFFNFFHIWNWREKMNSFHFFFPHLIKWTLPGVVYGDLLELKNDMDAATCICKFCPLETNKKAHCKISNTSM